MAFAKTMTDDSGQEYVTEIHGLTIRINKIGGGSVGKVYKNEYWEWHVTESGIFRGHHVDLFVGEMNHHAVAETVATFYDGEGF